MDAFHRLAQDQHVGRIAAHLREHHGDSVTALSDIVLRHRIEFGIEQALQFDLQAQRAQAIFVSLMVVISPAFYEHKPFRQVFQDETIPAGRRIDAMLAGATAEDWEAASLLGDESTWPR